MIVFCKHWANVSFESTRVAETVITTARYVPCAGTNLSFLLRPSIQILLPPSESLLYVCYHAAYHSSPAHRLSTHIFSSPSFLSRILSHCRVMSVVSRSFPRFRGVMFEILNCGFVKLAKFAHVKITQQQ